MLQARYRTDYQGEFIITNTIWKGGMKLQDREFITNPVTNEHISGRAAVIGQDETIRADVVKRLEDHRGGLLGQKRLQTYGAEAVWQKIKLDFCVEHDPKHLHRMIKTHYVDRTVIYTSSRNCVRFPGYLYPVPYAVRLKPAAQAAYIAAFDGHKEIFILGVDGMNPHHYIDLQNVADMPKVFSAYPDVKFYIVTDGARPPDAWRNFAHVELMGYRKFITYCDV